MPARTRIPRIEIPAHLSDENAAQILESRHEVTRAVASRYVDQIGRYYDNLRTDMRRSRSAEHDHTPDPNSLEIDPF